MERIKDIIEKKVFETPFIDTHEHLIDESERLDCIKPIISCDDWTLLLSHYFKFDLISAGMTKKQIDNLFSVQIAPLDKWKILENYWKYLKNTASGLVFRNTIKTLYNIEDITENNILELQNKYIQTRKKGFYKYIIQEKANIRYCVVHSPLKAFKESEFPDLLHQDIALNGLIQVSLNSYSILEETEIKSISDWFSLIDLWFEKYGQIAKGVKIGIAYFRRLDFKRVQTENLDEIFLKKINSQKITITEEKLLQDYLFWYCVDKATQLNLPVKLHTGQLAMNNIMNMQWIKENPSDCASLCKQSPKTKFIFFHLSYPHYEEMLSLTKHYSNAYIDMCWSWSINPVAAKDFLKKFILTAPNNKIFTFGGDDIIVENLVGHSTIARKGIAQALTELVTEEWITLKDALDLVDILMYKNAENFFGK